MKIADALLLQRDISNEIERLRALAKQDGWEYRVSDPGAKWVPTFDLEANVARVKELSKLSRRLSRAVTRANNSIDLPGIDDKPYEEWL